MTKKEIKEIKEILAKHIEDMNTVYDKAFESALYSKRAFAVLKTREYALHCLPPETWKNINFREAMFFNTEVGEIALQMLPNT